MILYFDIFIYIRDCQLLSNLYILTNATSSLSTHFLNIVLYILYTCMGPGTYGISNGTLVTCFLYNMYKLF